MSFYLSGTMKLINEINTRFNRKIEKESIGIKDGCGCIEEADYILFILFQNHPMYDDIVMEFKEKVDDIRGVRACQLFSEELIEDVDCDTEYEQVLVVLIELIRKYK